MLDFFKAGDGVAIVRCSNPLSTSAYTQTVSLRHLLESRSLQVSMYEESFFDGSAELRADIVNAFYADPSVKCILDVSGGDLANELLEHLDYAIIKTNPKPFVGYSDLTCVINAIYAQTGNAGLLFNPRNLIAGNTAALDFSAHFLQGDLLRGIVVGGNVRCLLKTAGTPFFPEMQDKILFLEAYGGGEERVCAYFAQLRQMGVFQKVAGVLLGTFTDLDARCTPNAVETIARATIPGYIPIARTHEIGHAREAKALWIGKKIEVGVRQ